MNTKEQAIQQVTKSLDKALELAENKKGKKLHEEIKYFIDNIKRKVRDEEKS